MKVTGKASLPATFSGRNPTDADLKPTTKRKARNRRWKRVGGTPVVGRRSRPETPLLKWKVEEREKERGKEKGRGVEEELEDEVEEEENGGRRGGGRGHRRKGAPKVSARKLAAGLWLLQLPETVTSSVAERRSDRLGFKPGKDFVGVPFHYHHKDKICSSDAKDPLQSPGSASGTKNGLLRKLHEKEKERKARELIEEVCDELAKEIGEDKAELEAIKRDSMKLREEVDEERKMLQMAEVWREERVQMKLIDAKVALEERYSQMNKLIADLETFLRSRTGNLDTKDMQEAESLRQAADSVNVKEIKEFTYEPANPDDIFAVFEDVAFGEANEREIEPFTAYSPASHASKVLMVSPEMSMMKKDSIMEHSNALFDQNDEIEEDESGWETVSHLEDQGSSYSPEGSVASVTRNHRDSNFSGSGTEWEENACGDTPITEISEVCSLPARQSKKASSITRLWRSCPNNGENYKIISVGANGRLSSGRKSNGGIVSPDRGSGKGGLSPSMGQWSSPDSGHPHITKGMKGCIDWPRGAQKNSLKAKLLEARMESQKVQLRHVLKQKI